MREIYIAAGMIGFLILFGFLLIIQSIRENRTKKFILDNWPSSAGSVLFCTRCAGTNFDHELSCQDCDPFKWSTWGIHIAKKKIELYNKLINKGA